jgi:hypothetical protein
MTESEEEQDTRHKEPPSGQVSDNVDIEINSSNGL